MRGRRRLAFAVAAVVALALIGSALASNSGHSAKKPIVIGWAFDGNGSMAPFDGPALAAARLRINTINAKGGVNGRKLKLLTCDTQGNKPDVAKSCALRLVGQKANVIFTTCDVDLAAPVVRVAIDRGLLAVASCIGTDQMGPKRFGTAGELAFSYGNVAQDEGAADAQIAIKQGWKTATVVTDKQIVYSVNVCKSFTQKFEELGGKVLDQESWTQGDHTIGNVVSKVNAKKADTIALCTTTSPDLPTFVSGIRGVGNKASIIGAWELDGAYWLPKDPKVPTGVRFWKDALRPLGALAIGQLPIGLVTNGASGVTLSGSFIGDGGGLSNLSRWKRLGRW